MENNTYNTDTIINIIDNFFKKENNNDSNTQNKDSDNNLNIKGIWGSGKSTYIEKLKDKLENKKYNVKIFNIWEYEISNNIVVTILCDILRFFNYQPKNKFDLRKFIKSILIVGGEYALNSICNLLQIKSPLKYIKKIIKKSKDKEKDLLKLDNYNEAIREIIRQINLYMQYSKNIFIFDELDRCTAPKMIEFLSIVKNILFMINNCFFIVSCDSDRINRILEIKEFEKYTDKIFYNNININLLSNFDKKIINIDNELIENYITNFENDYRQIKRAIERKDKVIKTIEYNFNINDNKKVYEFITFWIYYKSVDLEKCIKNLSDKNLEIVVKNYFMNNQIFQISSDYIYNEKNIMQQKDKIKKEIIDVDINKCSLLIYNDKNQILPFAFFIPFILDIKNFNFKCIEYINNFNGNKSMPLKNNVYYVSYRNIVNYISDNFKDLITIIFEFFNKNERKNLDTNINIKTYFEYMQNIM